MIARRDYTGSDPITWIGRVPIYATTIIVTVYVVSMVGVALAMATGSEDGIRALTFHSGAVLHEFQLWRCLTYAFVNAPDPWFIIALVMFYVFGRDVEQFLGRMAFVRLFFGFVLIGPSLLLAATLVTGQEFVLNQSWATFAMFLTFAAIYPNAQLIFQIPAKFFAYVFLGLFVLQLVAMRAWIELVVLLATAFLAWFAVRGGRWQMGGILSRMKPSMPRKRPKLRVVREPEEEENIDPHGIIDPLLEKISRHGLSSLTKKERGQLERARAMLMEMEKH